MPSVSLATLPEEEQRSLSGKFHSFSRNLSLALGGVRNAGTWGGGHPFDLQLRRVPPGAAVCPCHAHLAQWELFVVRAGTATVRAGAETHRVETGGVFLHPPGEAHQLSNPGASDLEVLIIADNPPLDACYYPDSDKWGLRPPNRFFRTVPTDYFDGEDPAPPGLDVPAPPAALTLAAAIDPATLTPFAARCVRLDDLPWEDWASPKGKFRGAGRQVSAALGAKRRTPLTEGGHPFDLEFGRVRPGQRPCPYHSHAAQWECYLFTAGRGHFRLGADRFAVGPGDGVLAPPGVAHDFTNTGDTDLDYFLVADNPPVDIWHYPESGKWGFTPPRKIFRPQEADYFDGEE